MARFGDTGLTGTTVTYPLRQKRKTQGATREVDDFSYRGCPRVRYDTMWEFDGEFNTVERVRPFTLTTGNAGTNVTPSTNTNVARAYFRVERPGIITNVSFAGEDGVTQNGSNFLTFTGLNLQTAGDGNRALLDTTAHVNTTDANAAALNGGTNLTAKVIYALALTGTTAALYVKEGDLLEFTATATGTGAVVDAPQCIVKIRSLPLGLKPTVTHTGGATTNVPLAVPVANTGASEAILQLSATNEAQTVRLDFGDQLIIDPTKAPIFSCRVKVSGAATVTRFVWGLATAYNATLDNIAENIWFKLDGNSLALVTETDDNTTDTDDQTTGVTVVADTYAIYRIDMSDISHIKFWVNDNQCATIHAASALTASMLLQPFIAIQKDSGTGAQSITVDFARVEYDRF